MTKEEIMKEIQAYLERKFKGCEFYGDTQILDDLNSVVDMAYDSIYELLEDAERATDFEIENWNDYYREGAKEAYIQNIKDDMRTQEYLEKDLV